MATVLLIVMVGLAYRTVDSFRTTSERVLLTHDERDALADVHGHLRDMETSARGFIITGDETFLETYLRGTATFEQSWALLADLMADNPEQRRRLDVLEPLVQQKLAFMRRSVELRRNEGFDPAAALVATVQDKQTMDEIRKRLAAMQAEEDRLLAVRLKEARSQAGWTVLMLVLGLVLAGLLVMTIFLLVRSDWKARDEAARVLREAHTELDRFFTLSLDFLGIAGADGFFKRVSPAVTDILGWDAEEFLRRPFMEFVHPEDRAATHAEVERLIGRGEKTLNFENRYQHKQGGWRVLSWRAVPQPGGLMYATARDVTEKRRAEDQILQLNQNLQRHMAQLEAANKELEAFSYSVSHDLRAPLRHIDGYAQLLQKGMGDKLDPTSRRHLTTISASAKNLGLLIDELLQFSRMGRTEMRQTRFAMRALVDEVIHGLHPDAPERRIEWQVGELPAVVADPAMFRQVWANLLGNAVKYTRHQPATRIAIAHRLDDKDGHVFSVRDNGAGFDMRYADKLFGVFQRLHGAAEFEGTGIGLANVQRIILRHGGRVWAEGVVGAGATFYFSLPLMESSLDPQSAPSPTTAQSP